jgi:replicative DNA helicase
LFVKAIPKLTEDLPDTDEDLDKIISKMISVNQQDINDTSCTLGQVSESVLLEMVTKPNYSIPTGFKILDQITNGLHFKNLIILAADTSVGKTTLAWQISLNIAKLGHPVTYLTLEMSKEEMAKKALSIYSGINYGDIESSNFTNDSFKKFELLAKQFTRELPVYLEDKDMDANAITRLIREHVIKYKIKLAVIDHLHFMKRNPRAENRNLEIESDVKKFKALAKELDIAIIAIAQLNRGGKLRENKRPILTDLKDSGAIGQAADSVLFLHREATYNQETGKNVDDKEAEVIVAKNRHGERNIRIRMIFEGATCSIYENKDQV